jgi:protein disulfide-isomerase A1
MLTDATYDDAIKNNQFIMVLFFAPWCGHCKAFAPEYEKAAAKLKAEGKPYVLAKLNADDNTEVRQKEGIESYPTVKFFINGVSENYEGERTADDVISFLNKKSRPPSTELTSIEEIVKVKEGAGRRCIFSNEKVTEVYEDTAKNDKNYIFYHAKPELLKEVFPEVAENNVILLKDYDEGKAVYDGEMKTEPFEKFLDDHLIPLVSKLDRLTVDAMFVDHEKVGVLLFRDPATEEGKKLDAIFKEVAIELKSNDYIFVMVDIKQDWGIKLASHLVIEESVLPLLEIVKDGKVTERYRLTGKLDKDSMKKFIQDWKEGKAPRFYKSEKEPEDNKGPVYKAVATSFNKLVIENDDDVLVYYHSPWCKYCKGIMKTYQILAESLEDFEKLKFVEVDGHKNDLKEYAVEDYPALRMFRGKNKSEVINHEDRFTEHAMAVFIKAKASHTIDIPELRPKDEGERNTDDL